MRQSSRQTFIRAAVLVRVRLADIHFIEAVVAPTHGSVRVRTRHAIGYTVRTDLRRVGQNARQHCFQVLRVLRVEPDVFAAVEIQQLSTDICT
jgi:hypothetical protein